MAVSINLLKLPLLSMIILSYRQSASIVTSVCTGITLQYENLFMQSSATYHECNLLEDCLLTALSSLRFLAPITILQPLSAYLYVISFPIPEEAPVITTTESAKHMINILFIVSLNWNPQVRQDILPFVKCVSTPK